MTGAFLCLLVSGSCALIMGEEEPQLPEPADQEVVFTGPKTFEEEFPYVRFIDNPNGTMTAVLTVPKGSGAPVGDMLRQRCPSLKAPEGETPSATLEVVGEGGRVFDKNMAPPNGGYPWNGDGTFKGVEDLLLVTGDEQDLREVFEAVDVWFNSGPQISISAVVFENINNDSFERGIVQIAGEPIFQDAQGQAFLRSIGGGFPATTNPNTDGSGLGGAFQVGLIDSSFQLDAVLQFLEQSGLTQVVSNPKIVTRNGVTASVESIEEIPFLNVTSVSLSGAAQFSVGTKNVGVTMKITPFQVGVDTIHLVIDVEVSRLGQDFVIGVDGNDQQIVAPSLNTRKASTEVYVRNGTTVIIGGLKLKSIRDSESKVPILGDLPVLGWLFSNRSEEELETTVTFMFTPEIKDRPSIDRFGVGDFFDPFDTAEGSE